MVYQSMGGFVGVGGCSAPRDHFHAQPGPPSTRAGHLSSVAAECSLAAARRKALTT